MKRLLVTVIALFLVLGLSGCQIAPADITDLVKPPKLAGEQQSIQLALEKSIGSKYTLKYPIRGKYRSAFILKDLDGDGIDEAIVMYSLQGTNTGTRIMIMKRLAGEWAKSAEISGDGNEIERISFGAYGGNGIQYLTVGWTEFTSTEFKVNIYQFTGSGCVKMYSGVYTDMSVLDMNGDHNDDLLLLKIDSVGKTSEARLVSMKDGRLREVARAPLDSNVSSYAGIYQVGFKNGAVGVYIDGYKPPHAMVTELLYYENGNFAAPFYDYTPGAVFKTLRNVVVNCRDINDDSIVEIPFVTEMPGYANAKEYSSKIWQINWCDYDNVTKMFQPVETCIWNFSCGYYFIPPKSWETDDTVQSDSSGKIWTFREWSAGKDFEGRILFEVTAFSQQKWDSMKDRSAYTKAFENGGYVFAVKMGAILHGADSLYLSSGEVLKRLKPFS